MERSCNKEYTCKILKPYLLWFRSYDQCSSLHNVVKGHSQGQNIWRQWKGPVTRNIHVKYESPICYSSEVMIKVKVFCHSGQRSKFLAPIERSCHKEYICEI